MLVEEFGRGVTPAKTPLDQRVPVYPTGDLATDHRCMCEFS